MSALDLNISDTDTDRIFSSRKIKNDSFLQLTIVITHHNTAET